MLAKERPYIYRQKNKVFIVFPSSTQHWNKSTWKWQEQTNKFICTSQAANDVGEATSNVEESCNEHAASFHYFDALYGVLTIDKSVSFLLYVAESTKVATIDSSRNCCVNDSISKGKSDLSEITSKESRKNSRHEIYEVSKLKWMQLPSNRTKLTCDEDRTEEYTEERNNTLKQDNNNNIYGNSSTSSERVHASNSNTKTCTNEETTANVFTDVHKDVNYHDDDDDDENRLAYYHCLLEQFCQTYTFPNALSQREEHTFFYYSPTCNIALSPHTLIKRHTCIKTNTNSESINGVIAQEESINTFQWNKMLLSAFSAHIDRSESNASIDGSNSESDTKRLHSETNPIVCKEDDKEKTENSKTCSLELAKGEIQTNEFYYVPAFIRGYVQEVNIKSLEHQSKLLLITRLACRWSGTRYNRRGAEPNHSGVCANMAITSLWFFHNEWKAELGDKHSPLCRSEMVETNHERNELDKNDEDLFDRVAVIDTIRGSVPLQWSQPPNLSFKPTIYLNERVNQAEVLERHLRLLSCLLPYAESLLLVDTMSTSRFELPLSSAYAQTVHAHCDTLHTAKNKNNNFLEYSVDKERSACDDKTKNTKSAESTLECEKRINESQCVNTDLSSPSLSLWKDVRYLKVNLGTYIRKCNLFHVMLYLLHELQGEVLEEYHKHHEKQHEELNPSHTFTNNMTLKELMSLPWLDYSLYDSVKHDGKVNLECTWKEWQLLRQQTHYVRVNCLDCIDRTNIAQTLLMYAFLINVWCTNNHVEDSLTQCTLSEVEYNYLQHESTFHSLEQHLQEMMTKQGIALSLLYAHTPTHFRSTLHTREGLLSRWYSSGKIAMKRWCQQNFADGIAQDAFTLLTGQCKSEVKEQVTKNDNYKHTSQTDNNATTFSMQSFAFAFLLELFIELMLTICVIALLISKAAKGKYGKCNKLIATVIVVIIVVVIMLSALLYRVAVLFKRARVYVSNCINKTKLVYNS